MLSTTSFLNRKNSITFAVVRHISIYYFSFALLLTALQIIYEYYNIKSGIDVYVSDIQDNFTASLTNSIWEFNDIQTVSLIRGIVKSQNITKVTIFSPSGGKLYSSEDFTIRNRFTAFSKDNQFEYATPLIKSQSDGTKENIGTLVIYSDQNVIFNQLSRLIKYIITNSIVKTVMLWFVLVFVLNKKLRQPLSSLTSKLSSIDPSSPEPLEFKNSDNIHEFFEIKMAFNHLINQVNSFKEILEAIVANKTTLLKKKNVEVNSLINDLEKAQERIIQQERLSALGLLTAGIAHELKNPLNLSLNSAKMLNDLLEELEIPQDEKDNLLASLKIVINNNQKMNSISQTMLLQSRSIEEPKHNIELKSFIENNFLMLKASNQEIFDNMNYSINIPENYNVNVYINDFGRLLINLFENSLHALLEKKHDSILNFTPNISINLEDKPNVFVLSIFDNGKGISEKNIKKIFTPFFTTKSIGEGTGLGLYLNMEIIKKHNGEISVDSKLGEFTVFKITLPKK